MGAVSAGPMMALWALRVRTLPMTLIHGRAQNGEKNRESGQAEL